MESHRFPQFPSSSIGEFPAFPAFPGVKPPIASSSKIISSSDIVQKGSETQLDWLNRILTKLMKSGEYITYSRLKDMNRILFKSSDQKEEAIRQASQLVPFIVQISGPDFQSLVGDASSDDRIHVIKKYCSRMSPDVRYPMIKEIAERCSNSKQKIEAMNFMLSNHFYQSSGNPKVVSNDDLREQFSENNMERVERVHLLLRHDQMFISKDQLIGIIRLMSPNEVTSSAILCHYLSPITSADLLEICGKTSDYEAKFSLIKYSACRLFLDITQEEKDKLIKVVGPTRKLGAAMILNGIA